MLREAYSLITILNEKIPVKSTTTILLHEENLIIQTYFKKFKLPYYFMQAIAASEINDLNDDSIILSYIQNFSEFYEVIDDQENFGAPQTLN